MTSQAREMSPAGLDSPLLSVLHVLVSAQHADSAVYSRLLQCSRALRDWVLTAAPQASLTLRPPDAGQPLEPWRVQLEAIQRALATRGALPASVVASLTQSSQPDALSMIPDALRGVRSIAQFSVASDVRHGQPDRAAVTAFLPALATALPSLRTLSIDCYCELPDPSLFSHVTSLAFITTFNAQHPVLGQTLAAASRYLIQLTALQHAAPRDHHFWRHVDIPWSHLFTLTTTTLTRFTTDTTLNDELIKALLQHAPNLTELSVADINIRSNAYVSKAWGVKKLTLTNNKTFASMSMLPVHRDGPVPVHFSGGRLDIEVIGKGLDRAVAPRFSEWTFNVHTVEISANEYLENQTEALRELLAQLQTFQAPGALVTLKRWFWHLTRLDILAAALPTLSHLRFGPLYCHSHLTDKALTAALQLNPPLTLSVPGISLDSDHSSTPWPWRDMIVHTLDVTALLKMPRPSGVGDGGCPVIRVEKLDFTGVKQEHVEPLKAWLAHVQWEVQGHSSFFGDLYPMKLELGSGAKNFISANAQLSVLQEFRWRPQSKVNAHVILDLSLTPHVMKTLATLPAWSGTLDFSYATWPLPPTNYRTLVHHIPTPYNTWRMSNTVTPDSQLVTCIAAGVNEVRSRLGLGPLYLELPRYRPKEDEDEDGVKVGSHVIVCQPEDRGSEEGSEDDFMCGREREEREVGWDESGTHYNDGMDDWDENDAYYCY